MSAATLAIAGGIELILAGRMIVQTLDVQGSFAQLVFDAGGILQSPFVDISKQPHFSHGVFEPDTIRAIIAYAVIGLVVPVVGIIGSIPGVSFNFARGGYRLLDATTVALAAVGRNSARAAAWVWRSAPQLPDKVGPAIAAVRARAVTASQHIGPALEQARLEAIVFSRQIGPALERGRLQAVAASQHIGPAVERGRAEAVTASERMRPAAEQAISATRHGIQQIGPAYRKARDWVRQAWTEAAGFAKELQARAISAAEVYRRWADGFAAKRH
ncbi:MAG TPA: hypothetical protein VFY10_02000 [Dehalococcoidia bacterium]|nr:hypothetical protein [Dehalococcoidia bacterium]